MRFGWKQTNGVLVQELFTAGRVHSGLPQGIVYRSRKCSQPFVHRGHFISKCSQLFFQCCLWNNSSICLSDSGPISFHGISSATGFFLYLYPPGSWWFDCLGFMPSGHSISSSSTLIGYVVAHEVVRGHVLLPMKWYYYQQHSIHSIVWRPMSWDEVTKIFAL